MGKRCGLTIKEGDELLAGALRAQGQRDSRQPVNRVQTEQDVIVLRRGVGLGSATEDRGGNWQRVRGRGVAGSPPPRQAGDCTHLQFVYEHGDGVELIVRIRRFSHGELGWSVDGGRMGVGRRKNAVGGYGGRGGD